MYRGIRLAGIAELPDAFQTSHAAESAVPLSIMRQRLLHTPYQRVFGAFREQSLLGIACLRREPIAVVHDRASLWGVYVMPKARGAGVARALAEAALVHARRFPELVSVSLSVAEGNAVARHLYASLGFEAQPVPAGREGKMVLRLDRPGVEPGTDPMGSVP